MSARKTIFPKANPGETSLLSQCPLLAYVTQRFSRSESAFALELLFSERGLKEHHMHELIKILTALHEDIDFTTTDSLFDNKIIDSFDIVTIIAEVHDRFDITISAEYIIPENFNSAQALWALIEKLKDEN